MGVICYASIVAGTDVHFTDSSVSKILPLDQARPTETLLAWIFLEQPLGVMSCFVSIGRVKGSYSVGILLRMGQSSHRASCRKNAVSWKQLVSCKNLESYHCSAFPFALASGKLRTDFLTNLCLSVFCCIYFCKLPQNTFWSKAEYK